MDNRASRNHRRYRFGNSREQVNRTGEIDVRERRHERRHDEPATRAQPLGGEPDVLLDVPVVKVDEIHLEVNDLRARVSLNAEVLDLLRLGVGADVDLGHVALDIKGVEAQALLKVRLENVARILDRVLRTIDDNPQILEHLSRGLESALRDVGGGTGRAVGEIGRGAGGAVEEVGAGARGTLRDLGRGAGRAVEDLGQGTGGALKEVGRGTGEAVEEVGRGTGEAVEEVGRGAEDVVEEIGRGSGEAAEEHGPDRDRDRMPRRARPAEGEGRPLRRRREEEDPRDRPRRPHPVRRRDEPP
ncbi:hypothetical protein ABGB18_01070 [Nonomuraea sp. B12E4]|uniref:hypothetical protein n=1 Tax=Nonomuraea sp. B12E4 TaxID=3153564 RepID=UPI00325C4611